MWNEETVCNISLDGSKKLEFEIYVNIQEMACLPHSGHMPLAEVLSFRIVQKVLILPKALTGVDLCSDVSEAAIPATTSDALYASS